MERHIRIFIVVGLLLAMGALMFIGDEPEPQLSIDELMDVADEKQGEEVHIRGAIVNGTLDLENARADLIGIDDGLSIDFTGLAVPDGMTEGKTISVRGILQGSHEEGWTIQAHELKTGCPSKYEAENTTDES